MSVCQASYFSLKFSWSNLPISFNLAGCLCHHPRMRSRIQAIAIPSELGDFSDEVRAVFLELGRLFGSESLAGECSPALDVHETDDRLEITVDLPGVEASGIPVLAKADSILVAG